MPHVLDQFAITSGSFGNSLLQQHFECVWGHFWIETEFACAEFFNSSVWCVVTVGLFPDIVVGFRWMVEAMKYCKSGSEAFDNFFVVFMAPL